MSKRLRTSLVITRLCYAHPWNMPLVCLASHAETGASSKALSSPLLSFELTVLHHGRLATPGPNCRLKESQTSCRRSQSCRHHRQRQPTKHEWPLLYPSAISESCRPTLDSLTLLAPSSSHLGISPQGTSSPPVSFGIDPFSIKVKAT